MTQAEVTDFLFDLDEMRDEVIREADTGSFVSALATFVELHTRMKDHIKNSELNLKSYATDFDHVEHVVSDMIAEGLEGSSSEEITFSRGELEEALYTLTNFSYQYHNLMNLL